GGFGGPYRGPITCDGYRGAPRLCRGATSAGGFGGPYRGPPFLRPLDRAGDRRRRRDATALGREGHPVPRLEHALRRAWRRNKAIGHPHRVLTRRLAHGGRGHAAHGRRIHLVHRLLGRGRPHGDHHRPAREKPGETLR